MQLGRQDDQGLLCLFLIGIAGVAELGERLFESRRLVRLGSESRSHGRLRQSQSLSMLRHSESALRECALHASIARAAECAHDVAQELSFRRTTTGPAVARGTAPMVLSLRR